MTDIKSKKILLVEDETINARLGKRTLEKHGYDVIHVNTGEAAVSAVKSEPVIDLILMDIDLGHGIDGTVAAEIILKDYDIPLVFLSSHTEPEVVEKTEGITSYGYIVKNTGETVLLASMKMAFRLFETKKKEEAKERKLREGEERYRSIFENTGTSMFLVGSDMTIEMVNDEFICRFGYTGEEVAGKIKWTELVHPDYLEFMTEQHMLRRSNECAASRGYEIKYITKSGEIRDAYLSVGMIPGTDQSIASLTDITDRKRAEQALHLKNEELVAVNEELAAMNEEFEAANEELIETNIQLEIKEQHYRTLFENTGSGIIVIEEDTTISLANDKFSETVGYSRHELEGKIKWPELVYEEDLERMLQQHRLRRQEPDAAESSYEFRFKIRSGELRDTLLFISMIPGTKKSIASLFDITDRKEAEAKLKISENKYRKIFENVQDVFYQTDLTGTIIDISPSIEKYSGFTREELIGKPVQEVYCDPADRDKLVHILLTEGVVLDYELRLKSKESRLIITSASSHIIFNSEGNPVGVEGTLRDITGRKKVEEMVGNLLEEKKLLLKEAHHRIKNNMNTVYGILYMQANELGDPLCADIIKDAASRVQSMMLLYDKLYRSETHHEIDANSYLPQLIHEITGIFEPPVPVKTDINIENLVLSARVLSSLGIMINELITNSMKYAFNNLNEGLIFLSLSVKDNLVTVVYRDNGPGIPESISPENSTGFGMELINMLVKQLQGALKIEKVNGAEFILEFNI